MGRVKNKTQVDPQEVYNYLVANKGLSKSHALGILANIQAESGFNASAIGDNGTSGGLFQHHASRFSALKTHSGGEWTNWQKQVDYALSEGATKKYVAKQFATPEDASMWWTTEWERPADRHEKAKQRVNNINKFTHFTEYEATPYQGGTASTPTTSSYTPGITPTDALSTPVRFQIMTADGPTFSDIDPVEFQKELDKLKVIDEKVEESPERLAIEEKKEKQKSFLTAMMMDSSSIVSYLPEGVSQDTGVVATEKIEVPEFVDTLPEMPNLFSTGQQELT